MFDINAIFPNLNLIRVSKRRGSRHGSGSKISFKHGKHLYFAEASKTTCTFVVSRSSRTTVRCGK